MIYLLCIYLMNRMRKKKPRDIGRWIIKSKG
jgi:hypothetical protein